LTWLNNPSIGFNPQSVYDISSLKELYQQQRGDFENWLAVKGITEQTQKGYLSALDRLIPDVSNPKELKESLAKMQSSKDKLTRGLKNFFKYMQEVDEANADVWEKWHSAVKVEQAGVREVYISNDELLEAYKHLKDRGDEVALTVFKALVYSGMRLKQLLRVLRSWDSKQVIKKGEICRYPVHKASKGKKKAFWLYFPSAFLDELESIAHTDISYHTVERQLRIGRVSANSIRKWLINFCVDNGISFELADFIEGRAAVSVGTAHYAQMTRHADRAYAAIVDKFPIKP